MHVLVTSRDGNVGIVELSTCDGLDAVCNDFTSLQREAHAFASPASFQPLPVAATVHTHIVIPSDTPIVPYCHPSIPCFSTACLTVFPRSCTGPSVSFPFDVGSQVPTVVAISPSVLSQISRVSLTHLQGLPSHQTEAIPTCGAVFIIFSFGTPAA